MLDMGFIHDIRKIIAKVPTERQTLFFSATMPKEIRQLADSILRNPARVQIAVESSTAERVSQSVYHVDKVNKPALLSHVLKQSAVTRAIVFTRTKHGADKVAKHLNRQGIRAEAIHGEKSQGARQRALANFKSQKPPVLVATDIAARGIDVDQVSHVINFDVPVTAETYVHRIGRTARAGASGTAISFCHQEERALLRAIEKLTRQSIPVIREQPVYPPRAAAANDAAAPNGPARGNGNATHGGQRAGKQRKPFGKKRVNARHHQSKSRPAGVGTSK
jgi:ATP-dependent RNA helicase RhlE